MLLLGVLVAIALVPVATVVGWAIATPLQLRMIALAPHWRWLMVDGLAVVGAPRDDDLGSRSGSAYVFVAAASGWQQAQKLRCHDST